MNRRTEDFAKIIPIIHNKAISKRKVKSEVCMMKYVSFISNWYNFINFIITSDMEL